MAWSQDGPYFAANADADLSAAQYRAVTVTSTGTVALVGAGEVCLGILQNAPDEAQDATVKHTFVSKAVAGGSFNPGAELTPDANGALVAATTGDFICGIALAAGASGRIVPVFIDHRGAAA